MVDMGYRQITDEKCKEMLTEQDQNKDGVISWVEFKTMMIGLKGTDEGKWGTLKDSALGKMNVIETEGGGKHFYT